MTLSLAVASAGCFCCLGCGIRWKTTTKNVKQKETVKSKTKVVWVPLMAIQEVLGWIFEPLIDLFKECGFTCWFCHNAPGLCQGGTVGNDEDDDEDDSYEKSSYNDSDEESEIMESDIESQTINR